MSNSREPSARRDLLAIVRRAALAVPNEAADALVKRATAQFPDRTPAEVLGALDKMYLAGVTTAGAAVGAVAAAPGIGTAAAVGANLAEIAVNIETTFTYALAYARIHNLDLSSIERRTTLLLAVLIGDSALGAISTVTERTGRHWARHLLTNVSGSQLKAINKVLGQHFVTKYGAQRGIIVLGRELPFFIGAGIGASANFLVGKYVVKSVHRAFGPPPDEWPAMATTQ